MSNEYDSTINRLNIIQYDVKYNGTWRTKKYHSKWYHITQNNQTYHKITQLKVYQTKLINRVQTQHLIINIQI